MTFTHLSPPMSEVHQDAKGLGELLEGLPHTHFGQSLPITHLSQDSRDIQKHGLFVAQKGSHRDGHDYIKDVLKKGPLSILAERAPIEEDGFLEAESSWVQVKDSGLALSKMASAWYGHPAKGLTLLAVTGTNGKTTTAYLMERILRAMGERTGLISTVESKILDQALKTQFTTPPAPEFQRLLRAMKDADCHHVLLEASSHGLHQHRLLPEEVTVAGFSNLSRDHLDYHGSMEAYENAKALLFEGAKAAAILIDSPAGKRMAERVYLSGKALLTLSKEDPKAGLYASDLALSPRGTKGTLSFMGKFKKESHSFAFPLAGMHNLENLLLALGMLLQAGFPLKDMLSALPELEPVPGRLERIDTAGQPLVFVDFAHSPDALEKVLLSLRASGAKRILCVFGAGGDRDHGKRPEMGRIAATLADQVIITSDNPRTEDPQSICQDIEKGMTETPYEIIPSRREAIFHAISMAKEGDLVLIAGKGHESTQEIMGEFKPFSDQAVAREALLKGGKA